MRNKLSKFALAAVLGLALTFTFGCSSDDKGGSSCNINGETVKIGNQTWMAENLNCDVNSSRCYNNDPANCAKYGRLYDWETAMKVCPSGWHLPSEGEWVELIRYVENDNGCTLCAGKYLKATSGWNNNGMDDYGFSALPGGNGFGDNFNYVGYGGFWWSSSKSANTSGNAYPQLMRDDEDEVIGSSGPKSGLCSVRCVKN